LKITLEIYDDGDKVVCKSTPTFAQLSRFHREGGKPTTAQMYALKAMEAIWMSSRKADEVQGKIILPKPKGQFGLS